MGVGEGARGRESVCVWGGGGLEFNFLISKNLAHYSLSLNVLLIL